MSNITVDLIIERRVIVNANIKVSHIAVKRS